MNSCGLFYLCYTRDVIRKSYYNNNMKTKINKMKLAQLKEDFENAIEYHLISTNYTPKKKLNWDTLFYILSCCLLSSILTTVLILWM